MSDLGDALESLGADKIAPKAYDDLLQPSAKEVGRTLKGVVRVALSPVNGFVWTIDRAIEWLEEAAEERLRRWKTPSERITSPRPEIAVPVIQGVQLLGEIPELRTMFANLLAKALDANTAPDVHPAFADIVRQLSPDEALVVPTLARFPMLPLLDLYAEDHTGERTHYVRGVSELFDIARCRFPDRWPIYMVNLGRLGIIETVSHPGAFIEPDYQRIIALPLVQRLQGGLDELELERSGYSLTFGYDRHQLVVTEFGHRFLAAVTEPDI